MPVLDAEEINNLEIQNTSVQMTTKWILTTGILIVNITTKPPMSGLALDAYLLQNIEIIQCIQVCQVSAAGRHGPDVSAVHAKAGIQGLHDCLQ